MPASRLVTIWEEGSNDKSNSHIAAAIAQWLRGRITQQPGLKPYLALPAAILRGTTARDQRESFQCDGSILRRRRLQPGGRLPPGAFAGDCPADPTSQVSSTVQLPHLSLTNNPTNSSPPRCYFPGTFHFEGSIDEAGGADESGCRQGDSVTWESETSL